MERTEVEMVVLIGYNLVPRVSHLLSRFSGKMRDPGNEVGLGCLQMDYPLKHRHQSIVVFEVNHGIEWTI